MTSNEVVKNKSKNAVDEKAVIAELSQRISTNQKTIQYYCNKYGLTTKEVLSLYGKMLEERNVEYAKNDYYMRKEDEGK